MEIIEVLASCMELPPYKLENYRSASLSHGKRLGQRVDDLQGHTNNKRQPVKTFKSFVTVVEAWAMCAAVTCNPQLQCRDEQLPSYRHNK